MLLVDADQAALEALQAELSEEYQIFGATSANDACAMLASHPEICAVVLTVNERSNNHAAMMHVRECVGERPVLLMLGFPRGPLDYVTPPGFVPFGLFHKGDSPHRLALLLREATRAKRADRRPESC